MLLIIIGIWVAFQATVGELPGRIKAWNDYLSKGGTATRSSGAGRGGALAVGGGSGGGGGGGGAN